MAFQTTPRFFSGFWTSLVLFSIILFVTLGGQPVGFRRQHSFSTCKGGQV